MTPPAPADILETPPVSLDTGSVADDAVSVVDDTTSQVDSLAEQNDTIGNVLVDAKSNKGRQYQLKMFISTPPAPPPYRSPSLH